ncbi:MAG: tRNA-intron lyase [Nanoarchaeota archaeon]|nr:tRNA-intron lyase [Nanoarchaeota archaeon]
MTAEFLGDKVIVRDEKLANSLHSKGYIGVLNRAKLELSLIEALYLMEKNKLEVSYKNKKITEQELVKKAFRMDKRFNLRYKVFSDLKEKGYVVKTALKYGFDYRVYDKGVKPGSKHADWLISCYNESEKFSWKDFSKLMRLSHGVNKSAVTAIVDDEGDVTYWESKWKKL